MCAGTERVTARKVSNSLDSTRKPEGLFSSDPNLLFRASSFFHNPPFDGLDGFLQLAADFNDNTPEHISESDLILILNTIQHPTASVAEICNELHAIPESAINIFHWIQKSTIVRSVMQSHYYPAYLFVRYAQSFLENLNKNPEQLERVRKGEPIASDRLEIHATNATCNYRCQMCLWHVKDQALYDEMLDTHILEADEWNEVLCQAKEMGTKTVIFSGGGEPLMRSDIYKIINHAKDLNLFTMIYTNGSRLNKLSFDNPLYQAVLNSDWLRVSLHATTNERYSKLVKVSESNKPLSLVLRGLEHIKKDRDRLNLPLRLGIGYVIQAANYDQVEDVVKIADNLGLDFLNLRVDCIDITQKLTTDEEESLYMSLRRTREKLDMGQFPKLEIDFADELVGPMNNWGKISLLNSPKECRVHLYRSAINPFGRIAVCDLTAEPWYSKKELMLGYIKENHGYKDVIKEAANKRFYTDKCTSCMPGQRAINALWEKVLKDDALGIGPKDQPLLFS